MIEDYVIRLVDMPITVDGLTIKDENDIYNIYINSRICQAQRINTFRHEMKHIRKHHFESELPVKDIEEDI